MASSAEQCHLKFRRNEQVAFAQRLECGDIRKQAIAIATTTYCGQFVLCLNRDEAISCSSCAVFSFLREFERLRMHLNTYQLSEEELGFFRRSYHLHLKARAALSGFSIATEISSIITLATLDMSAPYAPHTPSQANTPLAGNHDDKPQRIIQEHRPDTSRFIDIYKDIHQHPEMSYFESRTAGVVAKDLEHIGLKVTSGIGGHGVVGVLRNGASKTILTTAELDAIPVEEKTGLPYASKERMKDFVGRDQPITHACGHDIHIAALLASVQLLYSAKDAWSGTLLAVFQPNEEIVDGAQAMVDGGLYNACRLPDIMLAQHVGISKAGLVSVRTGPVLTALDHNKLDLFSNGIGSNPPECRDPVSLAS